MNGLSFKQKVLATMKSEEIEGKFELYVTRTPGYVWALFFKYLHVHPIAVTLLSIVLGVASGYFLASDSMSCRLVGIGLLVWANWYDCADGQLARLTGKKTLLGRILDGFAGDTWFFSIYFFICLRLTPEWGIWIWLLAAYAGLYAHSRQCAIADYYRNVHLFFLKGHEGSELDLSRNLYRQMYDLKWGRTTWFHKIYLFFYARYTRGQERMTPVFQRLYVRLGQNERNATFARVRERFLPVSRGLMKYCNMLTFDLRVGVLFVSVLLGVPWMYFLFEVVVLEAMRHYVRHVHEHHCARLLQELSQK